MKPTCRAVRSMAPSREVATLSRMLESHVGSCLSCQAELARYGKLRRQLASLADVVVDAPAPLAVAVADAIASGEAPPESESRVEHPARVATAAGAVVAAAAGAVAVAVWRHSKVALR